MRAAGGRDNEKARGGKMVARVTRGARRFGAGGALCALALALGALSAPPASAEFGFESFQSQAYDATGASDTRAGAHPDEIRTTFAFNRHYDESAGTDLPDARLRNVQVDLPPGLVGDPNATLTKCTMDQLLTGDPVLGFLFTECPISSQVGKVTLRYQELAGGAYPLQLPIFNIVPPPGVPARFAFSVLGSIVPLDASLRTGGDYGLSINVIDVPQALSIFTAETTFWGVPAAAKFDQFRGDCLHPLVGSIGECPANAPLRPLLSNPTSCVDDPLEWQIRGRSWASLNEPEKSAGASATQLGMKGCAPLRFEPSLTVKPGNTFADSPSGYTVELEVPQDYNPDGLTTAHLEAAVIRLPEGVRVSPSAANGAGACSQAEIGLDNDKPVACPNASRLGTVEVVTPLLDEPLHGNMYLAEQHANPFNSMLATYMTFEGAGVLVKLAGKVEADPRTGQLTASFVDNPQLPFSKLRIRFNGGSRAPLINPSACGTYTATGTFTPHSAYPDAPAAPVADPSLIKHKSASFVIDRGPGGGPCPATRPFAPGLSAGLISPDAGGSSPFVLRFTRPDGHQEFASLAATMPPGLTAKLAGVARCSDATLAAISSRPGSGATENAHPSCPAASLVGTATVGAGAGVDPVYVETGKAYLAGPYKGAPLSLAVVVPALAGPFDLGSTVVRSKISLDPRTAQVSVESDPMPTILAGIPLEVRDVRIEMSRDGFMRAPTNCSPMQIVSSITGTGGAVATPTNHFQVGECAALGFKPRLDLLLKGGAKRGAHPSLRATLRTRPGDANIGRAQVTLPRSAFLDQGNIRTICTRVQFAADACPEASIYGYAKAISPLLDEPLRGPVYLRSSSNDLPDMVADLKGLVDIELVGRIDSHNRGIRATFDSVPDAPVTEFTMNMQGGKKGLVVNSQNLCVKKHKAAVRLTGQNGKAHNINPVVRSSACGKGRKAKKSRR